MNKFFLCKFLFSLFFLVATRLFSMPESTEMPAEEMPTEMPAQPTTEMPTEMPAQPTTEMPTEMPAQPATEMPTGMPAQPAVVPPSGEVTPPAQPPAEEVKPEQLGEFKIDENQPEIMKGKDPNIRNLVKKSDELSKRVNDVAKQINEIRDKAFNKFSEINNSLDAFYQKIGFESGRAKELLKEQK